MLYKSKHINTIYKQILFCSLFLLYMEPIAYDDASFHFFPLM